MPFTYILHSQKLDKFYIGACNEDLDKRIIKHNSAYYGPKSFTSGSADWTLFLFFETKTFAHSVRIERKIKAMKSKTYINNIKQYPELKIKIFNESI